MHSDSSSYIILRGKTEKEFLEAAGRTKNLANADVILDYMKCTNYIIYMISGDSVP